MGVQWDENGKNINWMDPSSQAAFNKMAKCVIDEYDKFCPLPSKYAPNCVQGKATQTENIADNGGMRAAYRAYHNQIGLNGPDPLLPGDLLSQYNHDQLFFLSFATTWCNKPTDDYTYLLITTDSHSPDQYRILGTMRNFQSFRATYQCPAGSKYAPNDRCDVWISAPKFDASTL